HGSEDEHLANGHDHVLHGSRCARCGHAHPRCPLLQHAGGESRTRGRFRATRVSMSAASAPRSVQDVVMPVGWVLVLTAVVGLPYLTGSPTLDDDLTRYTVRLA